MNQHIRNKIIEAIELLTVNKEENKWYITSSNTLLNTILQGTAKRAKKHGKL